MREAEDALAKAEAQLLLATTPEEKAAALAAIEAAKERIETEEPGHAIMLNKDCRWHTYWP